MNTPRKLQVADAVIEAFANAAENGFSFHDATAEEITDDMMSFDADIEKMPREEVLDAVRTCLEAWKAEQQ